VITEIMFSALVMTTPLILTALGGLLHRASGIVNVGLDAMILLGALTSLIVASGGHWLQALIAAALASGLSCWLMSLCITRLSANEIIVGLGLNIAMAGAVRFYLKAVHGSSGNLRLPDVARLPKIELPLPGVLGAVLSGHSVLTWFAWTLIPVTAWALGRTALGLRLRACGTSAASARALGLKPERMREGAGFVAGALAGLAGAYLSIGIVGLFNEGITGGRGFIALAAFYFGANRPWATAACTLLLGIFDAVQIRLQGRGFPVELIQTLPYIIVIVVLLAIGLSTRHRAEGKAHRG
jgi:ABC-type uncharacterized transport system permease subunit